MTVRKHFYTFLLAIIGIIVAANFGSAAETPGWLGVWYANVNDSTARLCGLRSKEGAVVSAVVKGSPAEKGGLHEGDVILKMAGKKVTDIGSLAKSIDSRANDTTSFDIARGKRRLLLAVVIGVKTELESVMTVTAYNEERTGDGLVTAGRRREALEHYINALNDYNSYEIDFHLREKTIKIVQQLAVPPAVPEKTERLLTLAQIQFDKSTNLAGWQKSVRLFIDASQTAPWLADPYANVAELCSRMGDYASALHNYKLYLLASPYASDAKEIQYKMYVLEDKVKESEGERAAAIENMRAMAAYKKAHRGELLLVVGSSALGPGTFHWWQGDSFDIVYGIPWKSGLHAGLGWYGVAHAKTQGNTFVISHVPQIAYESNKSASSYGLYEGAFSMTRIAFEWQLNFGYRFRVEPVTFEPYLGLTLYRMEMLFLTGSEMNNKTLMDMVMRFGLPTFGLKVNVSNVSLRIQSATIWKPFLTTSTADGDYIDYDNGIMGRYTSGNTSSFTVSLGFAL